ncbi:hypothetical protein [Thermococcus sp. MAR1]|uniref:hypothetical protein n=1 Tax=Thermococcus sp. MAR1 TaxID=1638263 RepID=UPI00143B55FE|nr:hypothetical protein [Thermococcus sp. MAR1]NJE09965.1 hypothetical protein [Thermococcus sp. MAR1]
MIPVEIGGHTCKSILVSSTSKLFELLFADVVIQSPTYKSFLLDSGLYIVDSHGTKLLRMECSRGKGVLLDEFYYLGIPPETVIETYLTALFNLLEMVKIREKLFPEYYVLDKVVQPEKIEIKDHPAGFRRGTYTLIDELLARNYRRIKIGTPRKLARVRYDPLEAFGARVLANTILLFDKKDLRELAFLHFKDHRIARTLYTHSTDSYLNSAFFGYLKFKVRKFLGV